MALIVQKYGGTSVGSAERIVAIAEKIIKSRKEGHDLVVVVSAMSGETNRLVELASSVSEDPLARELDVLLSTGEQVTIALLSMALHERDCEARSYTGVQVHILTDSVHNKARIIDIDAARVRKDLREGRVVVVAGFQGVDEHGNITTLGRGGSDTTAVALAAAAFGPYIDRLTPISKATVGYGIGVGFAGLFAMQFIDKPSSGIAQPERCKVLVLPAPENRGDEQAKGNDCQSKQAAR